MYLYVAEQNEDTHEWEVIRETLDSGTNGIIEGGSRLIGVCPDEDTAVTAAFQMQRHGVTPRGVVDLTLNHNDTTWWDFVMCSDPHPTMRHTWCTRPVRHTGRHAAGNGDHLVAVWHSPPVPEIDTLPMHDDRVTFDRLE